MPKKKSKKPAKKKKDAAQAEHYHAIVMNVVESNIKLVMEKISEVKTCLLRRMDESDAKYEAHFNAIEAVVKIT